MGINRITLEKNVENNIKSHILKSGIVILIVGILISVIAIPAMAEVAASGKLFFTTSPTGAGAGGLLVPSPVVTVLDANGNTLAGSTASITINLGSNSNNAVLSGTTSINAVNGIATFKGLRISPPGSGYTLIASSSGLTSTTSASFNIMAPSANTAPSSRSAPTLHTVQGIVKSMGDNQITIQTGSKQPLIIKVSSDTKYFIINTGKVEPFINYPITKDNPQDDKTLKMRQKAQDLKQSPIPSDWKSDLGWLSAFNRQAQFSDIQIEDRVIVRINNDTPPLASQALIVKPPVIRSVKGTVTSINSGASPTSGTFVITPSNSDTQPVTLSWDSNTRFSLKGVISLQGCMATAIYNSKKSNLAQIVNVQATSLASESAPTPQASSNTTK
jgi:hypothetical protein